MERWHISFGCIFVPKCFLMIYNYNYTQPRIEVFVVTENFENSGAVSL